MPGAEGGDIAVRVQDWPILDQAIVVARLAQGRNPRGTFTPAELAELFRDLTLPPPDRPGNKLASLERRELVTRGAGRGEWKLTPKGRQRATELLSDMETAALVTESAVSGAPLFAHTAHAIIPPALAPRGILPELRAFLDAHPFDSNVFGMTRFPEEEGDDGDVPEQDPVGPALEVTKEVCGRHGLEFHLASDRSIVDDLWMNVAAHMWASRYGIAFFEDRRGRGVNLNLAIEVGGMLTAGRRCALLKDRTIPRMPTDLVGRIYKEVDLDAPRSVAPVIHRWIRDDLDLGSCSSCP